MLLNKITDVIIAKLIAKPFHKACLQKDNMSEWLLVKS